MSQRVRQAVVLAGGRGSRLGSLTQDTPKPLLSVGGRPFLDWVVGNLARQGVERVIVTTGYLAETFHGLDLGSRHGVSVSLNVEEEPLDTGGALCDLVGDLDEHFFVLNGDTLFDAPLDRLCRELDPGIDSGLAPLAAVALRRVEDVSRFGAVALEDRRVVSFGEKAGAGPGLINGGVYAMRRKALVGFSSPMSIERDLLPELVRRRRVTGLPCDSFFIDIGVPETYSAAQTAVPAWWERAVG